MSPFVKVGRYSLLGPDFHRLDQAGTHLFTGRSPCLRLQHRVDAGAGLPIRECVPRPDFWDVTGLRARGTRSAASNIPCWNAPELSNNIIQKRLAFDSDWSGTVAHLWAESALRSCPAGSMVLGAEGHEQIITLPYRCPKGPHEERGLMPAFDIEFIGELQFASGFAHESPFSRLRRWRRSSTANDKFQISTK